MGILPPLKSPQAVPRIRPRTRPPRTPAHFLPLLLLPPLLLLTLHRSHPPHTHPRPPGPAWALGAVVRDGDAPHVPEWVAWHRLAGVCHIYLYDLHPVRSDALASVVRRLVSESLVTIVHIPPHNNTPRAYPPDDALRHDLLSRAAAAGLDWAGFWPLEEFLYMGLRARRLQTVLESTRECVGVWLPRRRATTAGRLAPVPLGELASATYADVETEAAWDPRDQGRVVVRLRGALAARAGDVDDVDDVDDEGDEGGEDERGWTGASGEGGKVLREGLGKMAGVGAGEFLVNVEGVSSVAGRRPPFSGRAPFLIRHITRSYTECVATAPLLAEHERFVQWEGLSVSICEALNPTTGYYVADNFTGEWGVVARWVRGQRLEVCREMWALMGDWCERKLCCGGRV